MGACVTELNRVAVLNGVEINLNSHVTDIDSSSNGVAVSTASGNKYVASDLLFAGAPQILAKLRGKRAPASLDGSQMKINMLLSKLPRLKSGVDPKLAFAGTFHVNETYSQLEKAYQVSKLGDIPSDLPLEMYCHTLTDPTILSPELSQRGFHTLTLFGLHTPAALFDADPSGAKEAAKAAAISSLNQYLEDPIESVLAVCRDGSLAIEAKSPIDLDNDLGLPRGNIFHRDLDFPFIDGTESAPIKWGSETDDSHIFLAGAGARRGGGVSGIAGHNAAMAVLAKD
jgi:phytoene dehydrogenase-like protein